MAEKMYPINPIIKLPENLLLSDAMHKVNCQFTLPDNVKETYYNNATPHVCHKKIPKSENIKNELIVRQENILEKLTQIKEKLTRLQQEQNKSRFTSFTTVPNTQISQADVQSMKGGLVQDIVVYADSASPPYFLLPLKKLLCPHVKILLTSSVHSSSSSQVDSKIFKLFQNDNFQERSDFDVVFTVIWKNIKIKTIVVNTFTQNPISGDANILRYLSRLFPVLSSLNYESKDLPDVTETDYWLDLLQTKFLNGNNRERQNVLNQLNSKLCSYEFVNGMQYGISDIFLWSAFKQLHNQITFAMPANVENWLKKINKIEAFHTEDDVGKRRREQRDEDKLGERNLEPRSYFCRNDLEKFLEKNGIKYQWKNHKEVFTVDALMEQVGDMPGLHMKNLFLKDKKKNLFLLCARHDAKVNLHDVCTKIGVKELRFADENTLKEVLGVSQGCVTLFALVNDADHRVHVLIDSEATKINSHDFVNFHPLVNSATLGISPKNLNKFLELVGHKTTILNI